MTKKEHTPKRDSNGRFEKGASGNPGGRTPVSDKTTHPEVFRDMAFDVAEMPVFVTIDGKRRRFTLYQGNLAKLGAAGFEGDISAAKDFVKEVRAAADAEQRYMDSQLKWLQTVQPGYVNETDPVKRARMKELWDQEVAIAQGRRARRTKGLLARRRRS